MLNLAQPIKDRRVCVSTNVKGPPLLEFVEQAANSKYPVICFGDGPAPPLPGWTQFQYSKDS